MKTKDLEPRNIFMIDRQINRNSLGKDLRTLSENDTMKILVLREAATTTLKEVLTRTYLCKENYRPIIIYCFPAFSNFGGS